MSCHLVCLYFYIFYILYMFYHFLNYYLCIFLSFFFFFYFYIYFFLFIYCVLFLLFFFFFSSRRRHTRSLCDWSSDVCSSDLNVVRAYDADQSGDVHFFAMEFVDGTTLDRLVRDRGPLPVAEACEYVRQAADRKSVV